MSSRLLSILLVGMLVLSAGIAIVLAIEGPAYVEEQSVKLFEAQQELVAEQGAGRLAQTLRDLRIRLDSAATAYNDRFRTAESKHQMDALLRQIGHRSDHELGITLLVHDRGGRVLAVDPRAAPGRASILSRQDFVSRSPQPASPLGICPACPLDDPSVTVSTPLDAQHLLAANIDLETFGNNVFERIVRTQSTRVALLGANGESLYEASSGPTAAGDDLVQGRATLPTTDWQVVVEAPRSLVASKTRTSATILLLATFGILILVGAAIGLFWMLKRREYHQRIERVQALAHQDKLATLGMMAAGVSHEIRNAISACSMQIEVARQLSGDSAARDSLQRASKAVHTLADLASSLSAYAGKGLREPRHFELGDPVDHALRVVQPKLKNQVQIDREVDASPTVHGFPGELTQVVVNLLLNAYDAVSDTTNPRLAVRIFEEDDQAVLTVTDNGPGIEPHMLEAIFAPFYTTKSGEEEGGTGIGLWLSSQIVEQHGGTIRAENAAGLGARFRVSLPLAEDDPAPR